MKVNIFKRYEKVGETQIKGGATCAGMEGFEANVLYLHAIGQEMLTGHFTTLERECSFEGERQSSGEIFSYVLLDGRCDRKFRHPYQA